ncbi:hypothetical protein KKA15_02930 [Patescibacteria group bacterium]|nr:hypothetical protein [Patescibacteria group bacterium]
MSNLSQTIQALGLSENESKIYLALIELGVTNIAKVSQKADVKRTSCYIILETMIQKGIVNKTVVKGKQQYIAQEPEKLLRLSEEKLESLKKSMPVLKSMFNLSETKPRIQYYEGRQGYINICDDSVKRSDKEILFIGNLANLEEVITYDYDNEVYIPARLAAGKTIRIAALETPEMKNFRENDDKNLRTTRFLPEQFKFDASMLIYGDTIGIISSEKELMGLIIDSKPIAQMARSMFELIWPLAA